LGDYFLQVTDSNGCQANIPINVSPQQLPVIISPNLFEIVCKGDSSGSAIAFAGGGTAPYDYVWSVQNGDTIEVVNDISISDTLFGLTSGTYDLVVTDSDGCTDEMTYFFNEPDQRANADSFVSIEANRRSKSSLNPGKRDNPIRWVGRERTERSRNARPPVWRSHSKLSSPFFEGCILRVFGRFVLLSDGYTLNPNPLRRDRPRREPTLPSWECLSEDGGSTLQSSAASAKRSFRSPDLSVGSVSNASILCCGQRW
jgi:hypothetical protein